MKLHNMSSILNPRREHLYSNRPLCPYCGNVDVILVNSYDVPAQWRCPACSKWFDFEPEGEEDGLLQKESHS